MTDFLAQAKNYEKKFLMFFSQDFRYLWCNFITFVGTTDRGLFLLNSECQNGMILIPPNEKNRENIKVQYMTVQIQSLCLSIWKFGKIIAAIFTSTFINVQE